MKKSYFDFNFFVVFLNAKNYIKMKNLIYLFIFATSVLFLNSCTKNKSTYVTITVLDANGNKVSSGTIIHMFKESSDNNMGSDPLFSEISMTTNYEGVAEFLIPSSSFSFDNVITRFFTILKTNPDPFADNEVLGTTSLNIEEGKTYDITIVLSE